MPTPSLFKWRHFLPEIILLNVRWYCRYALSYRDLEEMMAERGIEVDHATINRWVLKSAPELDKRLRPHLRPTNDSWRVDETYIKAECRRGNLPPPNLLVKGQWVGSRKDIIPCPSQLDLDVPLSRHPAPDVLS